MYNYAILALTSTRVSRIVAVWAESSALSRVFAAMAVKLTLESFEGLLVALVSPERGGLVVLVSPERGGLVALVSPERGGLVVLVSPERGGLVVLVSLERGKGVVLVGASVLLSGGTSVGVSPAGFLHCRPPPGLRAGSSCSVGAGVASGTIVGVALCVAVVRVTGVGAGLELAVGGVTGSAGRREGRLLRTAAARMTLAVSAMCNQVEAFEVYVCS